MRINGISASAYELYDWCEWKYELQYGMNFSDESGPAAIIGHIAHKFFEVLSRASMIGHDPKSKVWDIDYLWKICFNRFYKINPEHSFNLKDEKIKLIANGVYDLVQGSYSPIRINTIGAEVNFRIPLKEDRFLLEDGKHLILRGVIDRVDKIDEDTIEIVDYKTGTRTDFSRKDRKKKDPSDLFEQIQPSIYYLASKELYPWAKNCIITFVYLADGGPISVPFSDSSVPVALDKIYKRFQEIKNNKNPRRNITWKCKLCPFKDYICDEVWAEKEKYSLSYVESKYLSINVRSYKK